MVIEWRKEMSVGSNLVDNDHQYLIEMINSFERSMETFKNITNLLAAMEMLEEYSKSHFKREEEFQRSIGYPGFSDHCKSHQNLINQLNDLQQKVVAKKSLDEMDMNKQEFVDFLRHWLIDHVIKEDLLFKPYIK